MASNLYYVESPEYITAELDCEEKLISYRKEDGTLVENVGIDVKSLKVTHLDTKNNFTPIHTYAIKGDYSIFTEKTLYERTGEGMIYQIQLIGAGGNEYNFPNFSKCRIEVWTDEHLYFSGNIFALCGMGANIGDVTQIYQGKCFYTPLFSKLGQKSGIVLNYKIPYYSSVRVILKTPGIDPTVEEANMVKWITIKDTEKINISYGGYTIPYGAYLHSEEIIDDSVPIGAMKTLLNTNKNVFVLSEMISGEGGISFQEGCIRAFLNGSKEDYTMLSTGLEDYFCFCHYFDGDLKFTPMCGVTYFAGYQEGGKNKVRLSAYRIHIDDPLFFKEGGVEITMRNGDQNSPTDIHSTENLVWGSQLTPLNVQIQSTYYTW